MITPIGDVTITPDPVIAGGVVNLKITYRATADLVDPKVDTVTDDVDQEDTIGIQPSYGRIRITLPTGWGPDDLADPAETIHLSRPPVNGTLHI